MLLRLGPFTLLTDPNFLHRGQRAYLGKGLWTKRLTEPALQPTQLPALDSILLSHLHADHWDRIATRTLDRDTPVITTQAAARALGRRGFGQTLDLTPGSGTSSAGTASRCGSPRSPASTAPSRSRGCCHR
jgi:L-ascorbate metabolism protein UlaG (beta-lactamase superfamily)